MAKVKQLRTGDIIKSRLNGKSWNEKYPPQEFASNSFSGYWYVYKDDTIAEVGYASDPSYCGGDELKGWDEKDFVLVNRLCEKCNGKGRIGDRIRETLIEFHHR